MIILFFLFSPEKKSFEVKIHRKRYGHEAQLIRGTKCRRDEIKLLNYFVCLFLKKNVLFQLNI